jgi:hypothetical protein
MAPTSDRFAEKPPLRGVLQPLPKVASTEKKIPHYRLSLRRPKVDGTDWELLAKGDRDLDVCSVLLSMLWDADSSWFGLYSRRLLQESTPPANPHLHPAWNRFPFLPPAGSPRQCRIDLPWLFGP